MSLISFTPIGIVHSPFKEPKGTPIQPVAAKGIEGSVEVFNEYLEGLADLEGFSHVILLYHFHLSKGSPLKVTPFLDIHARGVFSTRSPNRPNPIGISVVQLVRIEGNILHIKDLDIVDGSPLLDIKPYIPELDARETVKIGWLEKRVHRFPYSRDDGRFSTNNIP